MKRIVLLMSMALFACIAVQGCDNKDAVEDVRPAVVAVEPVDAKFMEQTSYNLPVWLSGGAENRILVRLSAFDGLSPVDPARLAEVRTLAAGAKYENLLAAGNVMNPDALYTSANVVWLAHELGVAREVIWVVPSFVRLTEEDLAGLCGSLAEILPQASVETEALSISEGVISGTVMGVPLKMVALPDLKYPGEPVLVSIDASFMYALYLDEKNTPSLRFLAGMFKILGEAELKSDYVGLSASNEDRRCPYKLRSFSAYFMDMLKDPEMTAGKPPKLWEERRLAWQAEQQDVEIALPIFRNIIENYPDDAATRYDLAEAYFRLDRLDDAGAALAEAAGLDPGYRGAFSEFAGELADGGRKNEADRFFGMMPKAVKPPVQGAG